MMVSWNGLYMASLVKKLFIMFLVCHDLRQSSRTSVTVWADLAHLGGHLPLENNLEQHGEKCMERGRTLADFHHQKSALETAYTKVCDLIDRLLNGKFASVLRLSEAANKRRPPLLQEASQPTAKDLMVRSQFLNQIAKQTATIGRERLEPVTGRFKMLTQACQWRE